MTADVTYNHEDLLKAVCAVIGYDRTEALTNGDGITTPVLEFACLAAFRTNKEGHEVEILRSALKDLYKFARFRFTEDSAQPKF